MTGVFFTWNLSRALTRRTAPRAQARHVGDVLSALPEVQARLLYSATPKPQRRGNPNPNFVLV